MGISLTTSPFGSEFQGDIRIEPIQTGRGARGARSLTQLTRQELMDIARRGDVAAQRLLAAIKAGPDGYNVGEQRRRFLKRFLAGAAIGFGVGLGAASIAKQFGVVAGIASGVGGYYATAALAQAVAPAETRVDYWAGSAGFTLGSSAGTWYYRSEWQRALDNSFLYQAYKGAKAIVETVYTAAETALSPINWYSRLTYEAGATGYYVGSEVVRPALESTARTTYTLGPAWF